MNVWCTSQCERSSVVDETRYFYVGFQVSIPVLVVGTAVKS